MAYYAPFYRPAYYGQQPDQMQYNQQMQTVPQVPQMQPVQQPIQAPVVQPQNNSGLIWVQGEAGAKSYLVAPGNTVMLMDSEGERFYLKSADASGMPMPLRIFDFKERLANAEPVSTVTKESEPVNFDKFVTREEFEKRIAAISAGCKCKEQAKKVKEAEDNGEQLSL